LCPLLWAFAEDADSMNPQFLAARSDDRTRRQHDLAMAVEVLPQVVAGQDAARPAQHALPKPFRSDR
jgi:hypothetical protein